MLAWAMNSRWMKVQPAKTATPGKKTIAPKGAPCADIAMAFAIIIGMATINTTTDFYMYRC